MKQHLHRILLCLALLLASCALLAVAACAATPMSEFDYARYGSENPDLLRAYGPHIYRSELYMHYLRHGAAEGRAAYSLRTGQPFELEPNALQAYEAQARLTGAQARLGNATLVPDRNWPQPLLALADEVLAQAQGATPYDTLRNCYDWLIHNCSYSYDSVHMGEGGRIAEDAYSILAGRVGVCDNYSAAFAVMARMLGFDARLQTGRTHRAGGGYTGHAWCVINIHGVDYVFDPQVEDNIAGGGTIRYLRFCKTYEEVPDKYILYSDDYVQDAVMAGGDAGPCYAFGEAGRYLAELNQARAAAGLSQLLWDTDLARAALRIAMGEDSDAVLDELANQTGKRCNYSTSYGYIPAPAEQFHATGDFQSAAAGLQGPSICTLFYSG